jgi:hypothetical protein
MSTSSFDAYEEAGHDPELQAQLCAYNTAFAELGLRFRWDARTFVSLASIDTEQKRITAYIEAHHAHLLNAYSAEFLSQVILDKKRAHYPACFAIRDANEANTSRQSGMLAVGAWPAREPHDSNLNLPTLAGI